MTIIRKMSIVLVLLTIYAINAFGGDATSTENRGRHHGPPPEAYAVCEDKIAGDTAQFVSPRGETVTGTCEQEGDRLVLRPDRPEGNSAGRHHGPPPEAYTACEGKNVGEEAQFVNPHGETVTGTCEQENDRLVLRPDRSGMTIGSSVTNNTYE